MIIIIKNKTILITGGAGFIGFNLFQRLISDNRVIIMDNFNNLYEGKKERLFHYLNTKNIKSNLKIIYLDICNYKNFNFINEPVDIVIHLSAHANVRYSMVHTLEVMRNNYVGTFNTIRFISENLVKKSIFTSSSAVYGNALKTPITEDNILCPISSYGVSKELEENLFRMSKNRCINTILRLSTVYGTYGRTDMSINGFIDKLYKHSLISIYGDGKQIRDFVYIDDIIDAILLALTNNNINNQVFNIGSGESYSINDIFSILVNRIEYVPKIKYCPENKGDPKDTTYNITKAKELIKYEPKVNLVEGITKTIHWYMHQNIMP